MKKKMTIIIALLFALTSCTKSVNSIDDMKPKKDKAKQEKALTAAPVSFTIMNPFENVATDYTFSGVDSATARTTKTGLRTYRIGVTSYATTPKHFFVLSITVQGRLQPGTYAMNAYDDELVNNVLWFTYAGYYYTAYKPFYVTVSEYNNNNELSATFGGDAYTSNGIIDRVKVTEY